MNTEFNKLLTINCIKLKSAMDLLQASLNKVMPYVPDHDYTADEREPYDALCDRFIRTVEMALKFFRTYEKAQFAEESDTLRDRLNRIEKVGLISSVELWFRMRDVRNRIVHDYLPEQVKAMYDDILGAFGSELQLCTQLALKACDQN